MAILPLFGGNIRDSVVKGWKGKLAFETRKYGRSYEGKTKVSSARRLSLWVKLGKLLFRVINKWLIEDS